MPKSDDLNYAISIIKTYTSIDIGCITSAKRSDTDLHINIDSDVKVNFNFNLDAVHNTARITNRGDKCICVKNAFSKDGNKTLELQILTFSYENELIRSSLGASLYSGLGDMNSMSFIKDENEFEHLKTQCVFIAGLKEEDGKEAPLCFNYESFSQLQGDELLNEIVRMISAWETVEGIKKVSPNSSKDNAENVRQQEYLNIFSDVLCQASILLNGERSVTQWRVEDGRISMKVLGKVG